MTVSQEDLDVIAAAADNIQEGDLPTLPGPKPDFDPVTPAVVNRVFELLNEQNGWNEYTVRKLRNMAKNPPYNRNHSHEQFQAMRDAYKERYLELRPLE